MSVLAIYKDLFVALGGTLADMFRFWWIWLPPFSFWIFFGVWMNYIHQYYKNSQKWIFLEIRMPRALTRGPKGMEQFLTNIHGFRNEPSDFIEWLWDGEVTMWFSFEIASFGGELHYYMRVLQRQRALLESQLYAQYPDVEIQEAEDYMKERFPRNLSGLYANGQNVWGTELLLEKSACYPIRTYAEFESPNEFEYLDPVSALLELLRKIDKRENIFVQILARPANNKWQKRGDEHLQWLKESTLLRVKSAGDDDDEGQLIGARTPGEIDLLKAVDRKIQKPGFQALIRYLYIADRSIYTPTYARRGVLAAINQYQSFSLNKFRHNYKTWTMVKWMYKPFIFPKRRLEGRKQRIYQNYRDRRMIEETGMERALSSSLFSWDFGRRASVLNTEEIATIYHFPHETVLTAPLIKRQESKTLGAPAELPIFGDEDDLPDFFKES